MMSPSALHPVLTRGEILLAPEVARALQLMEGGVSEESPCDSRTRIAFALSAVMATAAAAAPVSSAGVTVLRLPVSAVAARRAHCRG